MQLGFVIDHSRCIGCHACTVACKAENDVPLGKFRTWVKYTERGTFPEVRRSFAVLRCNQCTSAPCVTICPVRALDKRPDGIVDIDPAACIGCKACMQGCPYDALYLDEASGTAEKCHFCAHRTERGLAPACAVVCPTEAIVPGDFDDPESVVSKLRREHPLAARKVEAGTGPNVFYRDAAPAGLEPLSTSSAGGYLWAGRMPGVDLDAERFLAAEQDAERRARTTYDVDHPPLWGGKVAAYLFTKSLSAGSFLVLGPWLAARRGPDADGLGLLLAAAALVFLALTTVLLVGDLRRPERFLYILTRPNWSSWLTRGAVVLIGFGAAAGGWAALAAVGVSGPWLAAAWVPGALLAALAAGYTGWLFGQARGRVLWMRRGLWLHLIVQALVAGAALALLAEPLAGQDLSPVLRWTLVFSLLAHLGFVLTEGRMAPAGRRDEYERAIALITRGPFAVRHRTWGVVVGIVVPLALLPVFSAPTAVVAAAAGALAGLYVEEEILVRAGQTLPIS